MTGSTDIRAISFNCSMSNQKSPRQPEHQNRDQRFSCGRTDIIFSRAVTTPADTGVIAEDRQQTAATHARKGYIHKFRYLKSDNPAEWPRHQRRR